MARKPVLMSDPFDTIKRCGGYYEAVQDAQGNFLTPLVVTGSYEVKPGSRVFGSYLSLIHYNLAPLEQNPRVVSACCRDLHRQPFSAALPAAALPRRCSDNIPPPSTNTSVSSR